MFKSTESRDLASKAFDNMLSKYKQGFNSSVYLDLTEPTKQFLEAFLDQCIKARKEEITKEEIKLCKAVNGLVEATEEIEDSVNTILKPKSMKTYEKQNY
tara:strand:- start:492 stop:791 length:300 start_codon:yes stop_codon:yes gene_type:complete